MVSAVVALLASAAGATPVRASTTAERRSAAARAAVITLDYARTREAAAGKADKAAAAARLQARPCLDVWRSVPPARRELAGDFYFSWVVAARWSVDGPLTHAWAERLRSSRTIARVPVLDAGVAAIARSEALFSLAFSGMPDPCPAMAAWRDAGFTKETVPRSTTVDREDRLAFDAAEPAIARAARFVDRHGGVRGEAAASSMSGALDEVDNLVIDDCDPVARIVLPDNVEDCTAR